MLRSPGSLLLLVQAVLLAGCGPGQTELVLIQPDSRLDQEIVADVVDLLGQDAQIEIVISDEALADEAALDALLAGEADLALVSNSIPYRKGIATVMPLYPTVLHVGEFTSRPFESTEQLLHGARVFAGSEGSASRMMFDNFAARMNIAREEYEFVGDSALDSTPPDVFVVFAPIAPDRLAELHARYPDLHLISPGRPEDIGTGSAIDATTLLNPHLKAFVIPVGTYGAATPTPVLTVAVDMMLVARSDLNPSVVYDLVREIDRLRPALASQRPGLFQLLGEDIETANSTFVLHPGLIAYRNRNEPTVYERYSGVAEVIVTLMVACVSAGFAGLRIFQMRRKNRIDIFYTDVIAIRNSIDASSSDEERAAARRKIRELQDTAFTMLVREKLSADESFRIFISLCNDALWEIEPGRGAPGLQ